MKKFLLISILFYQACTAQIAGTKISDMPTFIGNPEGGWVPIVINNTNRKTDAKYLGYNKIDSLSISGDTLWAWKNQVHSFFKIIGSASSGLQGIFNYHFPSNGIMELRAGTDPIIHTDSTQKVTFYRRSGYSGAFSLADIANNDFSTKGMIGEAFAGDTARNFHANTVRANEPSGYDEYIPFENYGPYDWMPRDVTINEIEKRIPIAGTEFDIRRRPGIDSFDIYVNGVYDHSVLDSTGINEGGGGEGADSATFATHHWADSVKHSGFDRIVAYNLGIDTSDLSDNSIPSWKNVQQIIHDSVAAIIFPGITIDPTPMGASNSELPTSKAVKDYVDDAVTSIVVGGNSEVVQTTIALLNASSGFSTSKLYFITDTYKQGLYKYAGTVADQSTDNAGMRIVTADRNAYDRIVTNGIINFAWFGTPDYSGSGTTMSGTDNTSALNTCFALAGPNQKIYIPRLGTGWYFAGTPNSWTNSKIMNLEIDGDTYHNHVTFIKIAIGSQVTHRFVHNGKAIASIGLPAHNKATYDAGTGPNWNAMAGYFIDNEDGFYCDFTMNEVIGFRAAIHTLNGNSGPEGGQENRYHFRKLFLNKFGILQESKDGSSYNDKQFFFGGRITADTAIYFNGNIAGASKTGVATSNVYSNILIESCNAGLIVNGGFQFNSFIGCKFEGGINTGIFGPNKFVMNTNGLSGNNSFIGCEYLYDEWLAALGRHTTLVGTPIFKTVGGSNAVYSGSMSLGGQENGRMTLLTSEGLSAATKAGLNSSIDLVTIIGHNASVDRPEEFANIINKGVEQTVSYDGRIVSITAGGTFTMVPPTGYIRVAPAGNSAVTIIMQRSQVQSGKWFWLEMVSTGSVEIRRADDNSVAMPTGVIASPGMYWCRYFNAGAFQIVPTKLGGTTTGTSPWGANGSNIYYSAGDVTIGSNPATTYGRLNIAGSTTIKAFMEATGTSQYLTNPRNGDWDYDTHNWRVTSDGVPQIVATNYNYMTFLNKSWQGLPIELPYLGINGGLAGQSIRINAAGTAYEYYTPPSEVNGAITITNSTSYNVASNINLIYANYTGGVVSVNLPTNPGNTGREIIIRNIATSGPGVSISNGDANGNNTLGPRGYLVYKAIANVWIIKSKWND